MTRFRLPAALMIAALALSACETRTGLTPPPAMLTQHFKLGHAVVVADTATKAPISRDATKEQLETAVTKAVKDRFSRLDGNAFYHLGINVDGYALAPPGVPLVVSPKSVMIVSVTLMSDTEGGKKLNEKPEQLTVFETLSAGTAIGSGLTKSAEEQLENLAFNTALAIEDWLGKNPQFFDPRAKPLVRAPGAAAQ
ncbi:hypothetical protein ACFOHK_03035 [Falsigemmobacter intermedius]|uniref:DUF4410 domain-containing protein n=1 Tax=Falsigemmobacter intermedius TaxID=1553448 RepID=A0A3S4XXC3_9RHOB|nr:hypothetical protein [Falsigemmobacter intermedius]RWY43536.1 hypothetical protein EP867_03775 [Falsigemmobacter intermedius]